MAIDIQTGAIGAMITLTCRDETGALVNLTDVATAEMIIRCGSGPARVRTATTPSPTSGGTLRYVTVVNDLQAGTAYIQGHVVFDDGTEFFTTVATFAVGANV